MYYIELNKIFDNTKLLKNTNVNVGSNLDNLIAYFLDLEILEDCHGKQPTIITFQVLVANWYKIIDDATIAYAILDRVDHSSHRIELNGELLVDFIWNMLILPVFITCLFIKHLLNTNFFFLFVIRIIKSSITHKITPKINNK